MVAIYPQIRINFLLRKSEALSALLVISWVFGDLCNGISCFVLDQLMTQKILGVFWMVTDLLLVGSHFYFSKTKRQYTSIETHYRTIEIIIYVVLAVVIVNNVIWSGFFTEQSLVFNEVAYPLCPTPADIPKDSARFIIGSIMAYATIPLYCSSRPG